MKKLVIGGTLAGVALLAFGQSSSVAVYGAVDGFVAAYKGSSNTRRLTEGGIAASHLGFRGDENLGGGLSAYFDIQAGFGLDTGNGTLPSTGSAAGGLQFTRQSLVGLSTPAGKLSLGRQYTPFFRGLVRHDPLGNNASFATSTLSNQVEGQTGYIFGSQGVRAENSVLYVTPATLPVEVQLMYAPGEASNRSGNFLSGLLGYKLGSFSTSYAYQRKNSGTAAAPVASPVKSSSQIIGFNYSPQGWMVGATYARNTVDLPGSLSSRVLNVGGRYDLAGPHSVTLSWSKRDLVDSPNDTSAYAIRYDYRLSKRTTVYGGYVAVQNSGRAGIAINLTTITPNSGHDGSVTMLGLMHRF